MPRVLKPCGTIAAHKRHQVRGEKPCAACVEAWNAYQREYYRLLHPNARSYRRRAAA